MANIVQYFPPSDVSPEMKQDPVPCPEDWMEIDWKKEGLPRRFYQVSEQLHRSDFIYPSAVLAVKKRWINHIISLVDNITWSNRAENFYPWFNDMNFHHFPFNLRKELTQERCREIVELILKLEENNDNQILVHCKKWQVRTGMVIAMYQIMTWQKWNLWALLEAINYGCINGSSIREILRYSK